VLWIRIGFNADSGPAFYLNADPDPDPGSQYNVDPSGSEFCQNLKLQKLNLLYEKNLSVLGMYTKF
jgi:hypothetical protein